MALEVRPPAPLDIRAADTPSADEIRSLPGTLEWLRRNGLLLQTDVEVSGDLELTGVQKHLDGSLPLLFDNVRGYPQDRVVTNLFASIEIIDRLFGWETPEERTRKLAHALTHPLACVEVSGDEAPCHEAVMTDDLEASRYAPPTRHTHLASALTFGSCTIVLVGDYFPGASHCG